MIILSGCFGFFLGFFWAADGGVEALSRSDLWPDITARVQKIYAIPSHNALLSQNDWVGRMDGGWRLGSPIPKQKLT